MHLATNDPRVNLLDAVALARHADRLGIPLRTKEQVEAALVKAAKNGAHITMADMMLRHGRLTPEAVKYVKDYLS